MGFRYRKSINLGGGFRVNISKSGIGYSWGVKGYRLTKTASGKTRQTISIPGTGISYVEESGGKSKRTASATKSQPVQVDKYANYSDVQKIGAVDANSFKPAEYEELFKQIKLAKLLNVLLIVGAVLFINMPILTVLCLAGLVYIHTKGRCYIEYEFDPVKEDEWNKLSAAWQGIASSELLRQITSTAKAKNKKVTAGIENAIDHINITAGNKLPWFIKTNVKPVVFNLNDCKLAILPDRLFLFDKKKYGAIDYKDITFELTAVGYLESEKVPKDAEIVKYAWAYANKDGSPDKRYSNNKQFPIMKYGRIEMYSKDGLNIKIMCSNEQAADNLNNILAK